MTDAESLESARAASRRLAAVLKGFSSVRPLICIECGVHVPGGLSDISAARRHLKWHKKMARALAA